MDAACEDPVVNSACEQERARETASNNSGEASGREPEAPRKRLRPRRQDGLVAPLKPVQPAQLSLPQARREDRHTATADPKPDDDDSEGSPEPCPAPSELPGACHPVYYSPHKRPFCVSRRTQGTLCVLWRSAACVCCSMCASMQSCVRPVWCTGTF